MSKFVRKKIRHDDETRAKIKAALIINRLMDCLQGKIELSPQQVTCGKALLDKVLPNLQAVDVALDREEVQWLAADRPLTPEEYEREFAKGTVDAAARTAIPTSSLPN